MSVIDFAFALLFFRIYCCYLPSPLFHQLAVCVFMAMGWAGIVWLTEILGLPAAGCGRGDPTKSKDSLLSTLQSTTASSALMPMRNDVDGAKVEEEEEEVYTYVHMETHDIAI